MTLTTEPPSVEAPDAGVIEEARARQRRHRGVAAAAITVAAAIAALVVVFDGGGGSSKAGQGSAQSGRPAGTTARASLVACSHAKPFIEGAPSQSLLSILGVLRRPATPADVLSARIETVFTRGPLAVELFVHYIRRARVDAGSSYYVAAVHFTGCGRFRRKPSDRIMTWQAASGGGGWGGGGGNAAQIDQGRDVGTEGWFARTAITMVVPDGVATVTLRYPAGRVGGFDRSHAPAVTTTTNVVGNVMVVTIPRSGNRLDAPMTMTWRAATGHVIKTFNRL